MKPMLQVEDNEPEDPTALFSFHTFPNFENEQEYLDYFNREMKSTEKARKAKLLLDTGRNEHERYKSLEFYPSGLAWGNLFAPSDCKTQILIGSAPLELLPFYSSILDFKPDKLFMLTNFVENKTLAKRYFPLCDDEPSWLGEIALQYEKQEKFEMENEQMSFGVGVEDVELNISDQAWGQKIMKVGGLSITSEFLGGQEDKYLDIDIIIQREDYVLHLPMHSTLAWKDFATSEEALEFEEMYQICRENIGKKIACHCSAGIGRAAVFVCCLILTERFTVRKELQLQDAANVVEELRLKRAPSAVQKDYEFKYIMDYVKYLNGLSSIE